MKMISIAFGLTSVLLLAGCTAESSTILQKKVNTPINILINGKKLDFSSYAPFRLNGETMVPLRQIVTHLGMEVEYEDSTAHVLIRKGNKTILLYAGKDMEEGSRYLVLDGKRKNMGAPVVVRKKTTYVPLSFVKEIGATNQWVSQDQTVRIDFESPQDDGHLEPIRIYVEHETKKLPGTMGIGFFWGSVYIGEQNTEKEPNGHGTLFAQDMTILYEGQWINGLPHGEGVMELSAERGITLEGRFEKASIVRGILKEHGKVFYEGTFGTQTLDTGKLRLPDGTTFKGRISGDQILGIGVIYTNEGNVLFDGKVEFEGLLAFNDFTFFKTE
ncbi:stalk domain-containing protein [Paenibacillus sp. VTT E-133291]|uniref:stalk domain-containing protein n=1 Tax=Paenibacillus sp. VTT E-133291 TaxID=1986223 RepID=UPI000BA0A2EE|nr:stalk domain-containing protein [Paenibacillus sp. VTT E-133291]OZQ97368.1 hypothetical protein CA598_06130 [Paenibacillus sp. VTT E-133291]